jgi:hypothetical protein
LVDEPAVEPRLTPEHNLEEHAESDQAADDYAEGAGMCPTDRRTLPPQHDQPDHRSDGDECRNVEPFKLHTGFTPT